MRERQALGSDCQLVPPRGVNGKDSTREVADKVNRKR